MSTAPAPQGERRICPTCRSAFRQAFPRCPMDGTRLELSTLDPLLGATLVGRYVIERCIGEGGMGRVYRAKHIEVSRRFAIKVMYGDLAADDTMRARFRREAEAASRLSHPNLVAVTDSGQTDQGLLYLAMDFIEGPSLSKLIAREGPLHTDRAMALFRQMTSALEHAHKKGLVHRDFKPENIIITGADDTEAAKILDFGIARLEDGPGGQLTHEGAIMGTPAFMAPEQAAGEKVDHRTDLFSLGMVVYKMVAGRLPFDGDPMAIMRQNLALDPPPMAERAPDVAIPAPLEAIVQRLLAKDPADRFQNAREVIEAIDEWWAPPRMRRMLTPDPGSSSGFYASASSSGSGSMQMSLTPPVMYPEPGMHTTGGIAQTRTRSWLIIAAALVVGAVAAVGVLWALGLGRGAATAAPDAQIIARVAPQPPGPRPGPTPDPTRGEAAMDAGVAIADATAADPLAAQDAALPSVPDAAPETTARTERDRRRDRPTRRRPPRTDRDTTSNTTDTPDTTNGGNRDSTGSEPAPKADAISAADYRRRHTIVVNKFNQLFQAHGKDPRFSKEILTIQGKLGLIRPIPRADERREQYDALRRVEADIARVLRRASGR